MLVGRARDPEVGQERAPVAASSSTFSGLTSRCTNAGAAGGIERGRDIRGDGPRSLDGQRALAVEQLAQRLARHLVHHVVVQAMDSARLMDGDDIGMPNAGEHAGLAEEALRDRGLFGELRVRDLDRYPPIQRAVGGLVHHTHAAPAKLPIQPVVRLERHLQRGEQVHRGIAHWLTRGRVQVGCVRTAERCVLGGSRRG